MSEAVETLNARDAQASWATGVRYSICTMVTRRAEHGRMMKSFRDNGFSADDCEFLEVDNTEGNSLDGYQACNLFLSVARGDYIIICHQDVELMQDGRDRLDRIIADLNGLDPWWGLLGNAGGVAPGRLALRISDPHGENQHRENLPAKVFSLDENFILLRRRANLAVSNDLTGFHLYGTDLCVMADMMGWSAYVVDFHLRHLSGGTRDASLAHSRASFMKKYARAFRPRWVLTPSVVLFLSCFRPLSALMASRLGAFGPNRLGRLIRAKKVANGRS